MIHLGAEQILAGAGVLLTLGLIWRAGRRSARRAAETARSSVRLMSLTGRVVLTAAAIVGVQWVVFAFPVNAIVRLVVLAVPALFAAYTLTRSLTVTTVDTPRQRGGRR